MILTTDALVGGTLSLVLITSTLPLTLNAARKATNVRRDLIAEQVAVSCTTALLTDDELEAGDLGLNAQVKAKGSCGGKGEIKLRWKSGETREIYYNAGSKRYVVR